MSDDPKKDVDIVIHPDVLAAMENDPILKAKMTEMFANMRQAIEAVDAGQYASFDDAMEAITGERPASVAFEGGADEPEYEDEDEEK